MFSTQQQPPEVQQELETFDVKVKMIILLTVLMNGWRMKSENSKPTLVITSHVNP